MALNVTLDQIDLMDIYRTFIPQIAEHSFYFKCTWNILQDHILGCKTSLSKFKKIEIISSIFSNHNGMKLEINYRKLEKPQISGD